MHKSLTLFAGVIVLALAVPVFAGGFFLVTGNPEASSAARSMNAVLTIKADGCGDASAASISATAIGIVNGERRRIPLTLVKLESPGLYGVARQWPAEGRWVLQFIGTDHDRVTHTLVPAGPLGVDRHAARFAMRLPTSREVAQLLETASTRAAVK